MSKKLNPQRLTLNAIKDHLSDELLFLITCCQTELSVEDKEFIHSYLNTSLQSADSCSSLNAERLTLNALISLANQHGILSLVYKTIKNLSPHTEEPSNSPCSSLNIERLTLNPEILTELKAHYMSISQRNMLMSAELIHIMNLFKENQIQALAFKGPTLASTAYKDITLRQFADLDILIKPKDLLIASQLLVENGFTPRVTLEYLTNKDFLDCNHDISFYKNITVELHWRLFEKQLLVQFDPKLIWTEKETVTIQNQDIQIPGITNLLIYLCIHGSKHAWERLEWIVDIDRLIRTNPNLNFQMLFERSMLLDAEHLVLLGIDLSHKLFDTPLPESILKEIENNQKVHELRKIIFSYLKENILGDIGGKAYYRKLTYFRMQIQKNLWRKVKYFYRNTIQINSSDIEESTPEKHSILHYYIKRLIRLIRIYT